MVALIILNIALTGFTIWKLYELKGSLMVEKRKDKGDSSPDQILKEWFYGGDA